jgi:hypothetical protein
MMVGAPSSLDTLTPFDVELGACQMTAWIRPFHRAVPVVPSVWPPRAGGSICDAALDAVISDAVTPHRPSMRVSTRPCRAMGLSGASSPVRTGSGTSRRNSSETVRRLRDRNTIPSTSRFRGRRAWSRRTGMRSSTDPLGTHTFREERRTLRACPRLVLDFNFSQLIKCPKKA